MAALDEVQAANTRAWRAASDWRHAEYPAVAKKAVAAAATLSLAACHLSMMARCFKVVSVADPWHEYPINGNPLNVIDGVKGWALVCLFASGLVLLAAHRRWVGKRVRVALGEEQSARSDIEGPNDDGRASVSASAWIDDEFDFELLNA